MGSTCNILHDTKENGYLLGKKKKKDKGGSLVHTIHQGKLQMD